MIYRVIIGRRVQKSVAALTRGVRTRVQSAIAKLANDPRPQGCKKLVDREAWRIRVGDYRVIYEIADDKREVSVIYVGHRSDAY